MALGLCFAGVQEKLGVMNKGTVYALWDYDAHNPDELSFKEGDPITILRRQDDSEIEWWWARLEDNEGYVPRNLLGVTTKTCYSCICVALTVVRSVGNWLTYCFYWLVNRCRCLMLLVNIQLKTTY